MESLLFDWSGWDRQDTMAFTFYDAVLKVDLSLFNPKLIKGAKFDCADIDYSEGILQFSNTEENGDDCIILKLGFVIQPNEVEVNPEKTISVLNTLVKE